jgi:hypothetical protein
VIFDPDSGLWKVQKQIVIESEREREPRKEVPPRVSIGLLLLTADDKEDHERTAAVGRLFERNLKASKCFLTLQLQHPAAAETHLSTSNYFTFHFIFLFLRLLPVCSPDHFVGA